jgi:hypothetical protein
MPSAASRCCLAPAVAGSASLITGSPDPSRCAPGNCQGATLYGAFSIIRNLSPAGRERCQGPESFGCKGRRLPAPPGALPRKLGGPPAVCLPLPRCGATCPLPVPPPRALVPFEGHQRMAPDTEGGKALGAAELWQVDDERRPDDLPARAFDELGCCLSGAARGDQVVHD